jgi:hypothetical protein
MFELGPHKIILQNEAGDTEIATVTARILDSETFINDDGSEDTDQRGEIIIAFDGHERLIPATGLNTLEVIGRLLMLAEAYILRTCDLENLTVYIHRLGDVKGPGDMFR